ncbi:hypothetical protein TNCV_3017841 [Trichonephila clavipes]|nr:hypothetical protein TNCV_3017841 [Trichonephila clavipes]
MRPCVSSMTLKQNFQAVDVVFLHQLVGEKVRAEKSHVEIMLITFFDNHGIIHKKFLPERTTMNANIERTIDTTYIEILTRFMKRLRRLLPQYAHNKDHGFGFTIFALTRLISSNSFWQKRVRGKLNIHHTRQNPILQTYSYFHDSNSI